MASRQRITLTAAVLLASTGLLLPQTASAATPPPAQPTASAKQADASTTAAGVRNAVVRAAKNRLGRPYKLEYGWTCRESKMDCECFNRNAIWHGTKNATGRGLQLNYWLQGQINQGRKTNNPRPGDLVFWDTNKRDGIRYGGDLDHTGIYIGNNRVINASAYYGKVVYQSVTLGGTHRNPLFVNVLDPNGY
ncbi:NlpC/P60 family protein [Streptomyces sp. DSM 42041]|uniref:NlpC/P60 family protein n=1 Tax=Streptomyces hazeniae TaxID=3075538 RepID=A0ABU2NZC4_9ACTN|nr:NlpC/P60 family protein [Streptomyces sp. DSM 42041]MDT0382334.1 NlpC/P60 family protein [Streptomyces sp. DSM 42041]